MNQQTLINNLKEEIAARRVVWWRGPVFRSLPAVTSTLMGSR
jgi:hypothetical protein